MLSSTTCARNGTVAPPSRFRIERMERRLSPTPGAFKLSTPGLVPLTDGGSALGALGPGRWRTKAPSICSWGSTGVRTRLLQSRRPWEQDIVLEMYVPVQVRLELLQLRVGRPVRRAGIRRGREPVAEGPHAAHQLAGTVVVVFQRLRRNPDIPVNAVGARRGKSGDSRKMDPFFLVHVLHQLPGELLHEIADLVQLGIPLSMDPRHLGRELTE